MHKSLFEGWRNNLHSANARCILLKVESLAYGTLLARSIPPILNPLLPNIFVWLMPSSKVVALSTKKKHGGRGIGKIHPHTVSHIELLVLWQQNGPGKTHIPQQQRAFYVSMGVAIITSPWRKNIASQKRASQKEIQLSYKSTSWATSPVRSREYLEDHPN